MPSKTGPTQAAPIVVFRSDADDAARLRARIALLVVAAVVPLLAFLMISTELVRQTRLDWLRAEIQDAARQAAEQQAAALARTTQLLHALAAMPPQPGGPAALCAVAGDILGRQPGDVLGVAVHWADGRPACAEALAGHAAAPFHAGQIRVALSTQAVLARDGAGGLVLARAIGERAGGGQQGGAPAAVLALTLAPAHLPQLTLPLRRELATRLLVDPDDGTLLAVAPDDGAGARVGDPLEVPRLLAAMRATPAGGVVLARDAAGRQRLYGFAELPDQVPATTPAADLPALKAMRPAPPVHETPVPHLGGRLAGRAVLAVGLPYGALLAEADAARLRQWAMALAVAGLGAVAAWLLGDRVLTRPVLALRARLPGRALSGEKALEALRPAAPWLRQQADLAVVAEAAGEMILRLDDGLRVLYASPATRSVLGYRPAEVIDADLAAEPGWEACRAQLDALRQGVGVRVPARLQARRRDEGAVWLEVRASRLADGGFVLACRDISAEHDLAQLLAEAQDRLATLALEDLQTGLANRRRFDAALDQEVRRAQRAQEPLALVLVGLAEGAGEEVLRRVARILAGALRRPGDLAARIDEAVFAVMLPFTDRIGMERVVARLGEALAAACAQRPGGTALPCTGGTALPCIGACSVLPLGADEGAAGLLDLAWTALRDAAAAEGRIALALPRPEPEIRLPGAPHPAETSEPART